MAWQLFPTDIFCGLTWKSHRNLCLVTNLEIVGDLKNEESVLGWLIDDDNRELDDEIEAVNGRMLDKLLETSPFMAVFFCEYF